MLLSLYIRVLSHVRARVCGVWRVCQGIRSYRLLMTTANRPSGRREKRRWRSSVRGLGLATKSSTYEIENEPASPLNRIKNVPGA